MKKYIVKRTLSSGFFESLNISNILDCVNGLKIDLTSSDKDFEYAEANEAIGSVVDILNKSLNRKVKPKVYSRIPSEEQIQNTDLISVFCIAINYPKQNALKMNRSKVHIHSYQYGVHNFNRKINEFLFEVDSQIKKLNYFNKKNRHSIFIKPVTDPIDDQIRKKGSLQPLIEYIKNPKTGTWMNYQKNINSNQMLYYI